MTTPTPNQSLNFTGRMQLLSQPAQVSDRPAPTDPELSCTCCLSKLPNPVTSLPSFCLHWLKITERIEDKLFSLVYKVLTTTQPSYLHNLITVQPPRSTRSSSLVTLAHPSTSSSLQITDRSFQYPSPRLWNQFPASLRQPRTNLSNSASPSSLSGTSSLGLINSPLIIHHTFITFLFCKSFPP